MHKTSGLLIVGVFLRLSCALPLIREWQRVSAARLASAGRPLRKWFKLGQALWLEARFPAIADAVPFHRRMRSAIITGTDTIIQQTGRPAAANRNGAESCVCPG